MRSSWARRSARVSVRCWRFGRKVRVSVVPLSRSYSTTDASIQTFVTIADAQAGVVDLPPINTSLCNFVRGASAASGDCMDVDPATWTVQPDARCEAGSCTETCTPGTELTNTSTCNAWKLLGGFAAQGVTIN